MEECRLVILRHGQTDANVAKIVQGRMNSHLSDLGRTQAEAASVALADEPFEAAYASDLDRAMDTARIVMSRHPGVEIHSEPSLREWCLGVLEGKCWNDLVKDPVMAELREALLRENCVGEIPGGETKTELQARVDAFLQLMVERHTGQTMLLVTHAGVLRRIFRRVVGRVDDENLIPRTDNVSISRIRYLKDKGWQLCTWNETAHLRGLPLE